MFSVDRKERLDFPRTAMEVSDSLDRYGRVELLLDTPIWILRGQQLVQENVYGKPMLLSLGRRLMFIDLDAALADASQERWDSVALLLMLPARLAPEGEITLQRCVQIDVCQEPDDTDDGFAAPPPAACPRTTSLGGVHSSSVIP